MLICLFLLREKFVSEDCHWVIYNEKFLGFFAKKVCFFFAIFNSLFGVENSVTFIVIFLFLPNLNFKLN